MKEYRVVKVLYPALNEQSAKAFALNATMEGGSVEVQSRELTERAWQTEYSTIREPIAHKVLMEL